MERVSRMNIAHRLKALMLANLRGHITDAEEEKEVEFWISICARDRAQYLNAMAEFSGWPRNQLTPTKPR